MAAVNTGGRRLEWNNKVLRAVAEAKPKVCADPAVGKQMSHKEMGSRLKRHFLESGLLSSNTCVDKEARDHRDDRRWIGKTDDP